MLEYVDLNRKLKKSDYEKRLETLHEELFLLQRACWKAEIPTLLAVEGWDGAGKGRLIGKLTERLEPRGFEVVSIPDQPRSYEEDLPWLWRIWKTLPEQGEMAIYDRSWNRRALVRELARHKAEKKKKKKKKKDKERAFDRGPSWQQSLRDIVDLERALTDDGHVVVKVFLHLAEDEVAARHEAWLKDPALSWRVQDKEWLGPDHYSRCRKLWEELLATTELPNCPWELVAATDKRWARIRVMETLRDRWRVALDAKEIA